MRFCTLEFLEEVFLVTSIMWLCSLFLLLPRAPLHRFFSDAKPWKYSSKNPREKELAISSADLAKSSSALRCFDFGWGGSVARVSNHTPDADTISCLTCERYRYFEYAGEEAVFKFDYFAKELADIDAANQSMSRRPFGGKCLDHIYRPDGCYLLLHTRVDFFVQLLGAIVELILGIENSELEKKHEAILTMNTLEDIWLLRWEVWAIRFIHGEVDALHQVCYCHEDLCNGDFEVIVQEGVVEEKQEGDGVSDDLEGKEIVEIAVAVTE